MNIVSFFLKLPVLKKTATYGIFLLSLSMASLESQVSYVKCNEVRNGDFINSVKSFNMPPFEYAIILENMFQASR